MGQVQFVVFVWLYRTWLDSPHCIYNPLLLPNEKAAYSFMRVVEYWIDLNVKQLISDYVDVKNVNV